MSQQLDAVALEVESALLTEGWYDRWETSAFADRLEAVAAQLTGFIGTDPSRVADLYEALIGGAQEAAESLDDSDGALAAFVETAFVGWVRARQAAGDEAEATIDALLAWMVDDDYGFCYRIEEAVVPVMSSATLAAFDAAVHQGLAAGDAIGARRWADILREVTWHQGDVSAYVAACDRLGWRPADALRLVAHHEGRQAWPEALHWAERGLALAAAQRWHGGPERELGERRRALLTRLGRSAEVLTEQWRAFEAHPSAHTYAALMAHVPAEEQATWRTRALAVSPARGLAGALDLYRQAEADDRIVAAVEAAADDALEAISHFTLEPIAARLEPAHAALAAKVHRALGWRIVAAGKSRYYAEALAHFQAARRCYLAAGLEPAWEAVGRRLRAEHGRKKGLLDAFERTVERAAPPVPSATERARARWPKAKERGGSGEGPEGGP